LTFQPFVFKSTTLDSRRVGLIHLPAGYADSDRRYPVLYLLHGMTGSEWTWWLPEKGNIVPTLAAKDLPYILVLAGDGMLDDGTYYMDWFDGSGKFEQHFVNDLVDYLDATFRTIASPEGRALGGNSTGGYAAVALALRNPTRFGAAASTGAPMSPQGGDEALKDRAYRVFGPKGGEYARERNPVFLVERFTADTLPRLFLDSGDTDPTRPQTEALHQKLGELGLPHEFTVNPGGHEWKYWSAKASDILDWAARILPGA